MSKVYYVLFKEKVYIHKLKKVLEEYNIDAEITPSPRALSSNCNHALKIDEKDYNMTCKLLKIHVDIKTAGIHEWQQSSWIKNLFRK